MKLALKLEKSQVYCFNIVPLIRNTIKDKYFIQQHVSENKVIQWKNKF